LEKKTSPVKKAVALKSRPGEDAAPKVVASGQGFLADKIIEHGEAADVKTHKDPALAEELYKIEIGAHIPPELYEIVAQVLVFINDLDKLEDIKRRGF
jgi:flagellar biosynthesis protein